MKTVPVPLLSSVTELRGSTVESKRHDGPLREAAARKGALHRALPDPSQQGEAELGDQREQVRQHPLADRPLFSMLVSGLYLLLALASSAWPDNHRLLASWIAASFFSARFINARPSPLNLPPPTNWFARRWDISVRFSSVSELRPVEKRHREGLDPSATISLRYFWDFLRHRA